ncbi:CHASE3 domain-containing protein [Roseomonas sp. NAR14]|uniref:histidine kinase n=1 Tax=Roseomonas acroporae TaxID=2937791 RepID=A0A9X1Y5W0_9PROT|nr:CHASE3 domain-containing protein [Roseomonas acroporae]MCK8784023.1 CHASE3 domain-containing protein [Roseomonas acroporae]
MPFTRTALGRATLALLLVGFLCLLGLGGATLWLVEQTRGFTARVEQTQLVRSLAYQALAQLQNLETGQRGYLLTQDRAYLAPYEEARARLPDLLARLAAVTVTATGRQMTGELGRLADEKLAELAETIALVDAGNLPGAVAVVRTDRGRRLMDEARLDIDRLIGTTTTRLTDATGRLVANARWLLWVTLAAIAVIVLVAGFSLWLFRRYAAELEQAGREVQAANAALERRVHERTADLEAANAEIQRFAYIVSHDLRAPLVNVMGFTAEFEIGVESLRALVDRVEAEAPALLTAEARTAAREDLPEAVSFIRSSTQRMDGLINAILRLSREGRRRLVPERLRMAELVGGLAKTVRHQLEERGAVIEVAPDLPDLTSDRIALEQIFGNLLDNAVKYLDPARPGRIEVRGRLDRGPVGGPAGGQAVYEVEDNGRGIPARDHERIFELFRRSGAQDRPGEGIGLAHVRALVRRLGGSIGCDSEPGRGSVFRIVLPRVTVATTGDDQP